MRIPFVGTDANDIMLGLGGADLLEGRDRDDVLDGGGGGDTLDGGEGDDDLIGDSSEDKAPDTYVLSRTDNFDQLLNVDLSKDSIVLDTETFSRDSLDITENAVGLLLSYTSSGENQKQYQSYIVGATLEQLFEEGPYTEGKNIPIVDTKGKSILTPPTFADGLEPDDAVIIGTAGSDDPNSPASNPVQLDKNGNVQLDKDGNNVVRFRGTAEENTMLGLAGADTLEGNGGDDVLDGGGGGDRMDGGADNDQLIGGDDDIGDVFVISQGDDIYKQFDLSTDKIEYGFDSDDLRLIEVDYQEVEGSDQIPSLKIEHPSGSALLVGVRLEDFNQAKPSPIVDPNGKPLDLNFSKKDYHILISNTAEITADKLPAASESVERFDIDQLDDGITYEIRAVFDWDNSESKRKLQWLLDVEQFGSRSLDENEDESQMILEKLTKSGRVANQLKNGAYAFHEAENYRGSEAIAELDVSNLSTIDRMFKRAKAFNYDIGDWDVSNVDNMLNMFGGATAFNQEIGDWDVSNVTDMRAMFNGARSFNQEIGDWDVSNVESMMYMFSDATAFNQEIGDWDVSNVGSMDNMFGGASTFNQDIGDWDVSNVTDMRTMFNGARSFNQEIGNWDVSNVEDMAHMFYYARSFNQDIGDWDVSSVESMMYMFSGATSFNQEIGDWDVSNVGSMETMFGGASTFNQDIGDWDTSANANFNYMFDGASAFNRDLSRWDVAIAEYRFDPSEAGNWTGERPGEDRVYAFVNGGEPNWGGGQVAGSYDDYSYQAIIGSEDADGPVTA